MKAILSLAVSGLALISASGVYAQTTQTTDPAAAAAPTDASAEGEVVVTAERRTTNLQQSGIAATVLSGADLTRKGVNSVEQLQFASPSLTVNTAGQGNAFNIRGIGKTEQTSAIGVGVVTYRDGVATLPGYFQAEPYYDIASVEVLRGPQGTFAGGNATGGAIFITEQNPTLGSVGGYVLGQYGNYDNIKLQGAVNLPVSDTFALRAAGNMERRDTFYKMSGPWTGNPGNRRDWSGRLSALWQPTSQLKVLLKGDYNNIEYGGLPASRAYTVTGTGATAVATPNTADPLLVASDAYLNGRDEFGRVVLNVSYETAGGVTLRSISGYQKGTTQINSDTDATATIVPRLTFRDRISERIWSQEFNIVSPNTGPFTWVLGGYYQHDKITIPPNGGYYSDATPNVVPSALDIEIVGTNPKTARAVFGQAGYQLTDALQITAGARWSRTTSANDAIARAIVDNVGGTPITPVVLLSLPQKDKTVNKNVDWKVALNFKLDSSNFLYAFVATGTKAGGLNGPNVLGLTPLAFDKETVTDFEAGWKGTYLDGHLRTQLGGYYNIYKDFQVNIADPRTASISSIFNVPGKTKLYGVEASAQGNFDALQFDMSASISNSKLGTFYAIDPRLPATGLPACNAATGPGTARCVNLAGNEQNYAPKLTFTAGLQYAIPLSETMSLTPRVDYSHIAATWGSLFQNRNLGDRLEARDIVNAQLTLTTGDWSLAGYATNLTNQHYVGAINGFRRLAGAPRQYGVRVSRSF